MVVNVHDRWAWVHWSGKREPETVLLVDLWLVQVAPVKVAEPWTVEEILAREG